MSTADATTRRRLLGAAAVAAALVVTAACGSSDGKPGSTSPTTAQVTGIDYSGSGPYRVGVTKLTLGDREAVVYYPADPASTASAEHVTSYSTVDALPESLRSFVPPSISATVPLDVYRDATANQGGPFPVVLYSHGFGGFGLAASQQLAHLASWGFVAAAPEHTQRDLLAVATGQVAYDGTSDVTDLRDTLAALRQQNTADGPMRGSIDVEHVGAIGHSAGGRAVGLLAGDPELDVFIGQAPVAPLVSYDDSEDDSGPAVQARLTGQTPPAKPSMILAGERDGLVPLDGVRVLFGWLAPPKRLWVLHDAGHNSFTDQCASIRAIGGLSSLAASLPVPPALLHSGDDGCVAGYQDPAVTLAVVNHLDTAELRYVFGLDATDVSLQPAFVENLFPGAITDAAASP